MCFSKIQFTKKLHDLFVLLEELHCCRLSDYNGSTSTAIRPHLQEEVADPSQAVSDAGFGLAEPIVVGDADIVHVFKEGVFT